MNPTAEETPGSPRGIAGRVIDLIATRIELFAFEFAEERRIAIRVLALVVAGATASLLAIILVTSAGILIFAPQWRPFAAAGFALFYGAGAAWLFFRARKLLRERLPPFASTVTELKRDREWLGRLL